MQSRASITRRMKTIGGYNILSSEVLEIISEASRALPDHFKQGHPDIKWIGVRDIGNVLRHQYATLSKILLWNVVQDELPKLGTALETFRSRPHESGGE